MQPLTLQTTMAELLEECPAAGQVLARRGMACVGCVMAPFDTLGEAARAYGTDPDELLHAVSAVQRRSVRRRVPLDGRRRKSRPDR
jgi:hybrid cluster-associated redox disulfide protein